MIIFFPVCLNTIHALGRDYSWPRPDVCPCCMSPGLWGHGFVEAYFDGFANPVLLRRYRCRFCKSVHRLRPAGYFSRFQASIAQIRRSISYYLKFDRPPPEVCRVRFRHWFKGLKRKVSAYFGDSFDKGLLEGFTRLADMGITPVSRSI
jgi:hypothetical protein